MPITLERVLAELSGEEPDYQGAAARLGPDAVPYLRELVEGDDFAVAAKATSLAGVLGTPAAGDVIAIAARRADPVVRVVAAASLQRLASFRVDVAEQLLDDADDGVRRLALTSVERARPAGMRSLVERRANTERVATIRDLAARIAPTLPG